jgi:ankyrin
LWGYTECVKELLAHEADTSSTECVHDLPYGADTTILNRKRQTPLDIAKEKKHQAIIDILMEHKKGPGQQHLMDSNQDSPNKKGENISILSEVSTLEVAVQKRRTQQDLSLSAAAYDGRIKTVRKFLEDDTVDVNEKACDDLTALHYACIKGHRDIAKLLLDHGADIDAATSCNEGPLLMACDYSNFSTIKLLLDRGCAVNVINKDGDTPLHCVCRNSSTECVKELLVYGADSTIKNTNGKTPLGVAEETKNQAVIDILSMEHNNEAPATNSSSNEL